MRDPIGIDLVSAASTAFAALLLLAVGVAIGWQLGSSRRVRAGAPVPRRGASELRALCIRAMAICGEHVASSRASADSAVHRLTVLFSSTVQRLESSIRATRVTVADLNGDDGVMRAIARGEADLQIIVQMLESMHRSRGAMLAEVTGYARDLRNMASDVQKISMQVQLLSFNTAVEAARETRSGAGFSVVAREMRELAAMAGETARRMVRKVESIDSGLDTVFADEGRSANEELAPIARAEKVIHEVTEGFRRVAQKLSGTLGVLEEEARAVHGEVSDALVVLQFQDRVSQIQSRVVANLESLSELLRSAQGPGVDRDAWLRRMALDFIADDHGKPGAAAPSTVTFF